MGDKPTFRQKPSPDGEPITELPPAGTAAPSDIWLEQQVEDQDGEPRYAYFLVASAGAAYFPDPALGG